MSMTNVLVADDHSIVRMGLTSLLNSHKGLAVVGEAENGRAAVDLALRLNPDVVVMDLMMPQMDGATATVEILKANPRIKVIILTTFGSFKGVYRALDAGAAGAILKSADNDDLIHAIEAVVRGETVIAPEIKRLMSDSASSATLTDRQLDILRLVVRGLTNGDISSLLGIREDSVKKLIHAIFEKIGATNRAEAVSLVHSKNLLEDLPDPTSP